MSDEGSIPPLGHDEIEFLVTRLAESRGGAAFTQEEAAVLVRFASNARADYAMLRLIEKGLVDVDVQGGQVVVMRKGIAPA